MFSNVLVLDVIYVRVCVNEKGCLSLLLMLQRKRKRRERELPRETVGDLKKQTWRERECEPNLIMKRVLRRNA